MLDPKDIAKKALKVAINEGIVKRGPTPAHGNKNRGVGITRKNKSETKKALKLASKQRKINHKMANKKHHKTGSNKRK
jgi:hypothetical protein